MQIVKLHIVKKQILQNCVFLFNSYVLQTKTKLLQAMVITKINLYIQRRCYTKQNNSASASINKET